MKRTIHVCFDQKCWTMNGRITDVAELQLTLVDGAQPFEPNVVIRFDLPGNVHALATVPLRAFAQACETMCNRVNAVKREAEKPASPWGVN